MAPFRHDEDETDKFQWNNYAELHLINSLAGLKATGVNYHWCLAVVYSRFTSAMCKDISLNELEKRLSTFYDFKAAAKRSRTPFIPQNSSEFALPTDEFPGVDGKKRTGASGAGKASVKASLTSSPALSRATPETKTEERVNKKKPASVASSEKNTPNSQPKKLRKKPPTPQPPPKRSRR